MATIMGILAVVGVLLPWHSVVSTDARGVADLVSCQRGYDSEFFGRWTLILAALGTASLLWFAAVKTSMKLSRTLLLAGVILFAAGAALTLVDLGRELGQTEVISGNSTLSKSRGFGLYLTLGGSILALLLTFVTFLAPRTIYERDEE
jgi:hypothetical protein